MFALMFGSLIVVLLDAFIVIKYHVISSTYILLWGRRHGGGHVHIRGNA